VYGFHSKWASTGDRIIFTVRRFLDPGDNRFDAFSHGPMVRFDVLTLRPDGTDIYNAVPASRWELGGHHINFFPDGSKLSLNLRLAPDREMDLVQVNLDGSGECALTGPTLGSGHPTVHPNGTHILTDTYTSERWTVGDTTPLRWIDRRNGTEREVARFVSRPPIQTIDPLRLDPHPAWDRSWRYVTFNAIHGGTRRVFLADFDCLI
jgi:hypothetical protein